jgi:hypothetical protein
MEPPRDGTGKPCCATTLSRTVPRITVRVIGRRLSLALQLTGRKGEADCLRVGHWESGNPLSSPRLATGTSVFAMLLRALFHRCTAVKILAARQETAGQTT